MDDQVAGMDTQLIDLTDETIMSTPVPQATSTAQRNIASSMETPLTSDEGVEQAPVNSQLRGAVDDLRNLQEQLKAFSTGRSTTTTSSSSLGLLPPDNFLDFSAAMSEECLKDGDSDLALDLSLRMKRALAIQSVTRSASLHSGKLDPEKHNLDSSATSSVMNDIAARIQSDWGKTSSVQGNGELPAVPMELSPGEPAHSAHSQQGFISIGSGADVTDLDDLLEKFGDEDFLSQDAGKALLDHDEEEFHQEVQSIQEVPDQPADVSSDFSAVREGSHITLESSVVGDSTMPCRRKLSIGQFFSLRTEKIPDPGFQPLDDDKPSLPKAAGERFDKIETEKCVSSPLSSTTSSALSSVSKVQEMLCQFDSSMSGTMMVDEMMKGLTKKRRETTSKVLKDTLNLCDTSLRRALPPSKKYGVVDGDDASVNDENLEVLYQQIRNTQKSSERKKPGQSKSKASTSGSIEEFLVPGGVSDVLDVEDSVVCLSEKLPSMLPTNEQVVGGSTTEHRRKRDVARWVAQTSNEQSDASFEVRSRLNETGTAELALVDAFQDSVCEQGADRGWVAILPSSTTEFVLAVGVLSPVLLTFKTSGGRNMLCHVMYKGAENMADVGGRAAVEVELPDKPIAISTEKEQQLQAWVRPVEAGRARILCDVYLKDVHSNEMCILHYSFLVCGEEPKVLLCLGDNTEPGKMDFGLIPENCCVSKNISLENKSDAYLALALSLEQKYIKHDDKSYQAFSLAEHGSVERCSLLQVFLREQSDLNNCEQATVHFHPPSVGSGNSKKVVHRATLVVGFDIPNSGVVLKRVTITGRSFHARLSARQKPMTLMSQRGCALHKKVDVVKNLGAESVQVRFWLEDVDKSVLQVHPEVTTVEPGLFANVTVVFSPPVAASSDVVTGTLKWQVMPGGKTHSLQVKCVVQSAEPEEVAVSSSRPSSRSSGTCENSRVSGSSDGQQAHSHTSVSGNRQSAPPLKVEATHSVLSCESLALRRTLKLSTTVRNYATHSYKLRLSVSSQGGDFKMMTDSGEAVLSRVLKLHAMECKALKFQFTATQLGAAVGTVCLHQLAPVNSNSHKKIVLNGYGGTAKMVLRNMSRDANNKMWFSMGEAISPGQTLVRDIIVENRGTIPGFVVLFSLFEGPRMLYDSTALSISPAAVVVQPKHSETVRVQYRLSREDLVSLARSGRSVCEVATVGMILGDEPTRQRLRRLIGDEDNVSSPETATLSRVCSTFEKEAPIPDIVNLRDGKEARKRFCQSFTAHMVSVIADSCKDTTMASRLGEDTLADTDHTDTTKMFASLLQETVVAQPRPEESSEGLWGVQPREVALCVPRASSTVLTVWSSHATCQLFEVAATEDWLVVEPREGPLTPRCPVQLHLSIPRWPAHVDTHQTLQTGVMVYIENDCVLVKVVARYAEPRPQAASTPAQVRSRPRPASRALVLDRRELALPPTTIGHVSSAALGCSNTSDAPIQVTVSVSQPFFLACPRLVVPPRSSQVLLVYFSPAAAGLVQGHAVLSHAHEKEVVLLVGKGSSVEARS